MQISGIKCTIIYEKIKNSYIQIKDQQVFVKVPKKANLESITKLVESKKDWILKNLEKQEKVFKNEYSNGGKIKVLGNIYTIQIVQNRNPKVCINGKNIYCNCENNEESIRNLIDLFYKSIAKDEVEAAMQHISSITGLNPQEVNIKKLRATWGICSSKKTISINQNLMAYSRHAIEYVCLHEVCHLKYMNHSKDFWNMVEKYMPDYKLAKLELKGERR